MKKIISEIYVKNEKKWKKRWNLGKIEESVIKIINEKFINKVDEKLFNENMNKKKEDFEKQINDINEMKNNIINNEIIKKGNKW